MPSDLTGITFTNRLSDARGAANRILENGSGVAAGDFDGDGLPDLFFCSLSGESALYRNLGGWRFENLTTTAGLSLGKVIARGAVFAHVDGNPGLDLLVSTLTDGVLLFLNDGAGGFRGPIPGPALAKARGATTLTLADVDGNETLDLYVACYRAEDIRDDANVEARVVDGRTVLHPKYNGRLFMSPVGMLEYGEPDFLFLNDGHGNFREASWSSGAFLDEDGRPLAGPPRDWGLSAAFRDVTGDGLPDLYVCNDYWTPDRLWLNRGGGVFQAAPREALRHSCENSMGVDFADLDRDGRVEVLVVDMLSRDRSARKRQALAQTPIPSPPGAIFNRPQVMRNNLYTQAGDDSWVEIAEFAGLAASNWSWQPIFMDADLDGWEDVIISAGHRRDIQDLDATERVRRLQHGWPARMSPEARQLAFTRELQDHARHYPDGHSTMIAFRNLCGLRFSECSVAWGFMDPGIHQGFATADLDGDGDLDLAINSLNSPALIYRNEAAAPRMAVRLIRRNSPNRSGVGARITLRGGAAPVQLREIFSGGRYQSGCSELAVFAVGDSSRSMEIEVAWPGGVTTHLANA